MRSVSRLRSSSSVMADHLGGCRRTLAEIVASRRDFWSAVLALECGGATPLWMFGFMDEGPGAETGTVKHPKRCRASALQKAKHPKRWRATALQKTNIQSGVAPPHSKKANIQSGGAPAHSKRPNIQSGVAPAHSKKANIQSGVAPAHSKNCYFWPRLL